MRGGVCSSQLLLGIASAVFLGLSPTGLMSIIFLSFIEREREKRKLGVIAAKLKNVESRYLHLCYNRFIQPIFCNYESVLNYLHFQEQN
jgi:hypothetical protein